MACCAEAGVGMEIGRRAQQGSRDGIQTILLRMATGTSMTMGMRTSAAPVDTPAACTTQTRAISRHPRTRLTSPSPDGHSNEKGV